MLFIYTLRNLTLVKTFDTLSASNRFDTIQLDVRYSCLCSFCVLLLPPMFFDLHSCCRRRRHRHHRRQCDGDFLQNFLKVIPPNSIWTFVQWTRLNSKTPTIVRFCETLLVLLAKVWNWHPHHWPLTTLKKRAHHFQRRLDHPKKVATSCSTLYRLVTSSIATDWNKQCKER